MNQTLTLFDHFNTLTPYAVGFDRLFDQLAHSSRVTKTYPPYDIMKEDEYNFRIEMALAGFSKDDIEVKYSDNQLTIKSVESDDKDEKDVIHRGISKRKFSRSFTLADDVVVNGAELKDGMLMVELEKIVPDSKKPRTIDIK